MHSATRKKEIKRVNYIDAFLFPHFAPVAQLVEQLPFKEKVPRSIRGGRTSKSKV